MVTAMPSRRHNMVTSIQMRKPLLLFWPTEYMGLTNPTEDSSLVLRSPFLVGDVGRTLHAPAATSHDGHDTFVIEAITKREDKSVCSVWGKERLSSAACISDALANHKPIIFQPSGSGKIYQVASDDYCRDELDGATVTVGGGRWQRCTRRLQQVWEDMSGYGQGINPHLHDFGLRDRDGDRNGSAGCTQQSCMARTPPWSSKLHPSVNNPKITCRLDCIEPEAIS
ncbi:hypothetical protein ACRALDRAFT_208472 [Sodiomyces alcalophilus JCM 7366]|uniref:uncharacterized protein n=1 Tax=Sodiomyces alcalophilus JCM 7366 TaxID=591952 RepID=UPI0039B557F3